MGFEDLIYLLVGLFIFCVLISLERVDKIDFDKIERIERPFFVKEKKKRNFKQVISNVLKFNG